MKFDIITIFPKIFDSYFGEGILARARKKELIEIKTHDLRQWTIDNHKSVDDKPYGGGPRMVIGVEAFARVLNKIKKPKSKLILLSARGKQLTSKIAGEWATKYKNIILIAGRYEGVDERVKDIFKAEEISIGPYVLTGGEIPVMAVVDAVSRHIPEVLGKSESLEEKRYGVGVPVYTRPEVFIYKNKKYKVPEVLLSGDHTKIENWRIKHKK